MCRARGARPHFATFEAPARARATTAAFTGRAAEENRFRPRTDHAPTVCRFRPPARRPGSECPLSPGRDDQDGDDGGAVRRHRRPRAAMVRRAAAAGPPQRFHPDRRPARHPAGVRQREGQDGTALHRRPDHRPSRQARGHDAEYERNRRRVMAEEQMCGICGGPGRDDDEADHILPRSQGGGSERENLRRAHRECNLRRVDPRKLRGKRAT